MFSFVHLYQNKNFITLRGVLSCVMAFNVIFFHNCNRILADEADYTLVMWNNKIFRAPFTVENSSFTINVSFLGYRRVILPLIIKKIKNISCEIITIKSAAVNK